MAKFCTKCGKPLVEGQSCNCGNSVEQKTQPTTFTQPSMKDFQQTNTMNQNMMTQPQGAMNQPSKANNLFNECLNIIKTFIKKPVQTIENNSNENKFNHALIMTAVCALSAVVFVLVLLGDIYKTLKASLSMGGLVDTSAIETPYIKVGLITFIAVAGLIALMALLAYLILNKLFKVQTNYKRVLGVYAFSSIISSLACLVATVCNFIDYRLGFAILGLGLALNNHYVSVSMNAAGQSDKNKLGYVVVISQFVATFVIVFILYKIFGEDLVTSLNSFSSFGV